MGEVGVVAGHGQDPSFDHRAFDVVVLDHDVLLQSLDCVELVFSFQFGEQDLQGGVKGGFGWPETPAWSS